jgi:hypothetical protein
MEIHSRFSFRCRTAGKTLQLTKIEGDKVILGPADPNVPIQIKIGDEVQVDNSNFLTVQNYHRHQDPGPQYKVWDQFRDAKGKPIYPQRPVFIGPLFVRAAAGALLKGNLFSNAKGSYSAKRR